MAVDFDFDTDYNDDDANDDNIDSDDNVEELETEEEFDDEEYVDEADEAEQDGGGKKSSPLRLILLVLVVLVLLCVVCWLASRFISLPIPGFGSDGSAPSGQVAQDTPVPPVPPVPDQGQSDQVEGQEQSGEAVATDEATDAGQTPVEEATVDTENAGEGESAAGGDASTEPTEEPNVVAGPTATPGGDATAGGAPSAACEANTLPVANTGGPYVVTKGLTIVTLDGSGSTDPDGLIERFEWDFGDGETGEGPTAIHEYKAVGSYQVALKVTDSCGESHIATTNVVITTEGTTGEGGAAAGEGEDEAASCDANTPPVADAGGPYTGMMGKGQAIVTFDGSGSSDSDGSIDSYKWDFGDGESGEGQTAVHRYSETGNYPVILTVTDNCGATNESTADVTISGPTPPAETPSATPPSVETPEATATPDEGDNGGWMPPPVDPALGTVGFCYKVQYGDTLTGIAASFGVTLPQLAYVNGVSPNYYVKAGEGFFIPTGPVAPQGPNIYQAMPGDTLNSVAYQCGVSAAELAWINGMSENAILAPGQLVKIPPPWSY